MADVIQSSGAGAGAKSSSGAVKAIAILAVGLAVWSFKTFGAETDANKATIQQILDQDKDYDHLRVAQANVSGATWLPLYGYLAASGLVAKSYRGTFTLERTDDKPLPRDCQDQAFEFQSTRLESDRINVSLDAPTMNRLVPCNR